MGSSKFTLNADDVKKVGKNSALVGVAAALTYLSANLIHVDLGIYGAFLVPVISMILDAGIKWAKDNTKE